MCPYVHSENRTGIFTLLGEDAVWSVQVKNCIIHLCTNINIRDVFWLNVTSRKHYFFTKKLFLSHVKPRATSTESASQCSVPKEIRAYHNEVVVDNLDYSALGQCIQEFLVYSSSLSSSMSSSSSGAPPSPPAPAWQTFWMMGLATFSSSFCLSSNSDFSAS